MNLFETEEEPPEVEGYEMDEEGRDPPARTARGREALTIGGATCGHARCTAMPPPTGRRNLMPLLVDCAKAYCTVGEMVGVLKDEWGEFQQPAVF